MSCSCSAPNELSATVSGNTAELSWIGYQDSYNVRSREIFFFEDFEGGSMPTGWTAIDADGDGYNWGIGVGQSHSGTGIMTSASSVGDNSSGWTALTPDNWLITPQLDLQGIMSVWVRSQQSEASYSEEHFAIYLSTTGNSVSDFTITLVPETTTNYYNSEYTADLSAYVGQKGYIAIRHFNCEDMFRMNVDDFGIYGNWATQNANQASASLNNLSSATKYEWQVQGVNCDGNGNPTDWSESAYFTTPEFYTKTISGYDNNAGGYYLIASPVTEDVTPTAANGFLTADYDLYRYNHTASLEWENWKQEGDHYQFPIETGKGYLYASKTGTTLLFIGTLNANADVTLTYDGWNLIGNSSNETRYVDGEFYIMGEGGSEIVVSTASSVNAMEGIFVNGSANETVTFSQTNPNSKAADARIILDVVSNNNKVIDRAIVNFDRNNTLPKFMIDENNTKIYIPMADANYAVAYNNGQNEMPVNFKAANSGKYTISVDTEGINTNYLHLIDRLTGEDINLLTTPEYSFVSSTMDAENRFVVRFSETAANSVFAYQSGNDIIVNGNGELQVFDIMGRMVMNTTVNGTTTVNLPSNAVYIFRMVGETVNTQKIVVR